MFEDSACRLRLWPELSYNLLGYGLKLSKTFEGNALHSQGLLHINTAGQDGKVICIFWTLHHQGLHRTNRIGKTSLQRSMAVKHMSTLCSLRSSGLC